MITKKAILASAIFMSACCSMNAQIVFGSDIDAEQQIKVSKALARTATIKTIQSWDNGCDKKCSYYFKEAGRDVPFRVCVPKNWNKRTRLPLVMFLHGSGNDESSYLDHDDKLMVKLANQYGFLLVSPLGLDGAYGTNMRLPGMFNRDTDTWNQLNSVDDNRKQQNKMSEKDVINVIEIILKKYPIDTSNMYLMGHSMGSGGTWYIGAKYSNYWKALAPISGPFVMEDGGYPWENLKTMGLYITEGQWGVSTLDSSKELYQWLKKRKYEVYYYDYPSDHGGMVPLALPGIFQYFTKKCYDVNRDGDVNSLDVLKIYKYMQTATETSKPQGEDLTHEDVVNSLDVLKLYKYMQAH